MKTKGAFKAQLQYLPTQNFSEASLLQAGITPNDDMEQKPPTVPKLAWVKEEEDGATSAQQPEEHFQLLQEGER
ncbi:hypothetical protein DUI87_18607 [Hirundo rustica rustica]|uniref:Uncharacterized protein n=1 Tax=Hirundo rustica rustica TaxID=333673 RepID=A0A3M0JWQ8_HIRRU|nr:hypothetical protein DUI87_18607 [Hirundo rustica rustica]